LIGRVAGRSHRLAAEALDLEFTRALRQFSVGNLDLAPLRFLDQQLAADQILHRILENRARLLRGVGVDEPLLGLRVVLDLCDSDRRAIDGYDDGIFGVRFHQRQDSEKSLLPREAEDCCCCACA